MLMSGLLRTLCYNPHMKTFHFTPQKFFLTLFLLLLCTLVSSCTFESVHYLQNSTGLTAFEEVEIIGAENAWNQKKHPFVGATPIDIDGDGTMEIFVGGGDGYDDMLFAYRDNALKNIIEGLQLSDTKATHGATSIDLDDDGDTDLLLARSDGVFLYVNHEGVFSRHPIALELPPDAVALNVAVGDIDRDGDGDLYISIFIDLAHFRSATFSDPSHAKTNVLLRNDGNLSFTDITDASHTASKQNTFLSSFMDLDGDTWPDLVMAQNTGQIEIFRNLHDNTFAQVELASGYGFWMGLASGDIDSDGDQDLFFTNSGNSVPAFLLDFVGDRTDQQPSNYSWLLLRNDGDFKLHDVTDEYQLNDYGFAWGAVFEDLSLDGELELLVAQNYIKWPIHEWSKLSGKSFVQSKGKFYHAPEMGLETYNFAQSPLIVDINHDGKPDVFWVNMEGLGRAFINRSKNNFLTLHFPDTVTSIGAQAFVLTVDGKSYTRMVQNNTGMSTDQLSALTFGLGQRSTVKQVMIKWLDGSQRTINNPPINQVIHVHR